MILKAARTFLAASILCSGTCSFAQTAPATYWVQFTDKSQTPFSITQPEEFLSARSIARRGRQNIAIDLLDLPVDPAYVNALLAVGQFELLNRSKWFNAVTIRSTDTLALDTIAQLPFVHAVRMMCDGKPRASVIKDKILPSERAMTRATYDATYGASFRQISMMNGHLLHDLGNARGENMLIGILDAGFQDANTLDAFEDVRARNGIVYTRDFVQAGGDVFASHWHGRSVFSVMAGHLPGKLLGTAPNADYVLLRTENADTEYLVEEDNWVSGAEVADSIGCDVLNTSLGYTLFDDSTQDHTYAQMDGQTTRIAIAEGIASKKGMIPVNSAGNQGSAAWHFISTPADAIDILTVGAVGTHRESAPFSSRGPSADGRVKPDVCAVGWGTIGLGFDGLDIASINGTSFSSPLVCGLTACLWQLHRDRSAHEIMDAIRRSSSTFDHPNDSLGYGIPDFWRAHLLLGGSDITHLTGARFIDVHPLPFSDHLDIELYTGEATSITLDLFDVFGRSVWNSTLVVEPDIYTQLRIEQPTFYNIANGSYVLQATLGGHAEMTRQVIKAE